MPSVLFFSFSILLVKRSGRSGGGGGSGRGWALLPLRRAHARQRRGAARHAARLKHDEAHKVARRPVAAVRAEHVQVLNLERAAAGGQKVVNLAIL